jgi:hypothetical protein
MDAARRRRWGTASAADALEAADTEVEDEQALMTEES